MRFRTCICLIVIGLAGCADPTADRDGDGSVTGEDCDDNDPGRTPGRDEVFGDGIDQDCSGSDAVLCFFDGDVDGYGYGDVPANRDDDGLCSDDAFQTAFGGDCDDSRDDIYPGGPEVVDDGIDQDCSGADRVTCWPDGDLDGYGADGAPQEAEWPCSESGLSNVAGDCDDGAADIRPGELDVPDDGIDQDCSGADTVSCYFDGDSDGFGWPVASLDADGSCDAEQSQAPVAGDCDDSRADIFPGAVEVTDDGVDQDCNGADARACYVDDDGDGIGAGVVGVDLLGPCGTTPGLSWWNTDCDDTNATVLPSGTEIADDGIDQDCSGTDTVTCLYDGDGDGFGADGTEALDADGLCLTSTQQASAGSGGDCDDSQPTIYPGALEIADDGLDQDCNGADTVTCYDDLDSDGFGGTYVFDFDGSCTDDPLQVGISGDCDDNDASAYPYATEIVGDGIDQDCNGADAVTCWYDGDGDGYGDALGPQIGLDGTCNAVALAPTSDDCDDTDPNRNPGEVEACNAIDDDCDGTIDHGLLAAFLTVGGTDRVEIPAFDPGTGSITIEGWGRWDSDIPNISTLVGKGGSTVDGDVWLGVGEVATSDGERDPGIYLRNTTNSRYDMWGGGTLPGEWRHLAATYDGTTQTLYLDGVVVASAALNAPLVLSPGDIWALGGFPMSTGGWASPWHGAIDDVRIWSDVRTQAEIVNTMCDAPDVSDPDLVAWWPLEGDFLDGGPSGYDGTPVGPVAFYGR